MNNVITIAITITIAVNTRILAFLWMIFLHVKILVEFDVSSVLQVFLLVFLAMLSIFCINNIVFGCYIGFLKLIEIEIYFSIFVSLLTIPIRCRDWSTVVIGSPQILLVLSLWMGLRWVGRSVENLRLR